MSSSSWLWIVAPLYITWRIYWNIHLAVSDCDEVYNYWEPLHFLLYGQGQQTWEYAHEYALRTYAYLVPLQLWGQVLRRFVDVQQLGMVMNTTTATLTEPLALWLLLRASLAAVTAVAELWFVGAVSTSPSFRFSSTKDKTTTTTFPTAWLALALLVSTGMTHSAGAYLPSSTWMMVWMLTTALYLQEQHCAFCLVAVTATLTIGWPFGVVLLLPMGCAILWKDYQSQRLVVTLIWTLLVTILVQAMVLRVDQQHYGVWTSPTINIFQYNAAGGGDELYGVEPVSFYVKNLLLNLNLAAPLGLLAVPLWLVRFFTTTSTTTLDWSSVFIMPLLLWLAITVPRPHKEERFLFPIYPILILGAVLVVNRTVAFIVPFLASPKNKHVFQQGLQALVWIPLTLVSVSRTVALRFYYGAPLAIYAHLAAQQPAPATNNTPNLVCTCGEWYRFPSSFSLPPGSQLAFLPSSFHGQLPQGFSVHGSKPDSQKVLQPFNDQNLEQTERYQRDASQCHWIVDLEGSECAASVANKRLITSVSFLDATATTNTLHRTLYIPYLHEQAVASGEVRYHNYALYQVDHDDDKADS